MGIITNTDFNKAENVYMTQRLFAFKVKLQVLCKDLPKYK